MTEAARYCALCGACSLCDDAYCFDADDHRYIWNRLEPHPAHATGAEYARHAEALYKALCRWLRGIL